MPRLRRHLAGPRRAEGWRVRACHVKPSVRTDEVAHGRVIVMTHSIQSELSATRSTVTVYPFEP